MKISINDAEIELVTCGHCGAVPTEADAQRALQREIGMSNRSCSICQQKFKLEDMKLTHHYYGDEHLWIVDGRYEELIDVSHYSGAHWVRSTMHVGCLQRVAPGTTVSPH